MKPIRVNFWNSIMDRFGPSELALSRGVPIPVWLTVIYCLIFPVNGRRDVRERNRLAAVAQHRRGRRIGASDLGS
jgi:hypothetical protein